MALQKILIAQRKIYKISNQLTISISDHTVALSRLLHDESTYYVFSNTMQ